MFNVFICVSVMSVSIDEGGSHSNSSEDEADNLTTSSPRASSSSSTTPSSPLDMPSPFPPLSPSLCSPCSYLPSTPSSTGLGALDLESPCSSHDVDSVCGSGHVSPLLGPRSQCSGASSPDCEQERGVCVHHICVSVCVFCHNSIKTTSTYSHTFTTHNSNVVRCTTRLPGVVNLLQTNVIAIHNPTIQHNPSRVHPKEPNEIQVHLWSDPRKHQLVTSSPAFPCSIKI